MSKRVDIKNAVISILSTSNLFYEIYPEPNDIEKVMSFPVAWVYLGPEVVLDGCVSSTNYLREISLEITIGTKHLTIDNNMDELIDTVFDLMKSNFTLQGTSINLTPTSVYTDQGYYHPFALAALNFTVTTR